MRPEFRFGEGKISGVLSIVTGLLSVGGVLCFHFPDWLTTPELRVVYPVPMLRALLALFIFFAFGFGIVSFLLSRLKAMSLIGISLSFVATALGGWRVEVPGTVAGSHYLGLDWFILDLLVVGLLFIPFERMFCRLRRQKIFRTDWKTDLTYFFVGHVLVQVISLLILSPALLAARLFTHAGVQALIRNQPSWLQFLEIVAIADFTQYWIHRAFHRVSLLWRIHAIHHSITEMDWLAGSRLHLVDIVATRGLTLVPLVLLGFGQGPLQAYLVFVAFLATFIHVNTRLEFAPLRDWIATPAFHHWHHAAAREAVDKNFAVHLPLLDRIFGTYYFPSGRWPRSYGLAAREKVPDGYLRQAFWPLT